LFLPISKRVHRGRETERKEERRERERERERERMAMGLSFMGHSVRRCVPSATAALSQRREMTRRIGGVGEDAGPVKVRMERKTQSDEKRRRRSASFLCCDEPFLPLSLPLSLFVTVCNRL
jgi:hypothetical protein